MQPWVQPSKTDSSAKFALGLGLLSGLCCLGPLTGLPAIIVGALALRQIRASGGACGGARVAITGMACGAMGIVSTASLFAWGHHDAELKRVARIQGEEARSRARDVARAEELKRAALEAADQRARVDAAAEATRERLRALPVAVREKEVREMVCLVRCSRENVKDLIASAGTDAERARLEEITSKAIAGQPKRSASDAGEPNAPVAPPDFLCERGAERLIKKMNSCGLNMTGFTPEKLCTGSNTSQIRFMSTLPCNEFLAALSH